MMDLKLIIAALAWLGSAGAAYAQGHNAPPVSPASIGRPVINSWLTYYGDYSGRRFIGLKKINDGNVKNLRQAWVFNPSADAAGAILGGEGPMPVAQPVIKATPLLYAGVLYFTAINHVWAVDARTGEQKWHYIYRAKGGDAFSNRGVGIWKNSLFFLSNDDFLISLNRMTGQENWKQQVGNVYLSDWASASPMVIRNHVIFGIGIDYYDFPPHLESRNAETGALEWQWNVTPKPGEPGFETWPNETAAKYGGGTPWLPGTYDAEQNLYIFGTGNPQPVLVGGTRQGDNLYTCSIVAINPDTGKMKWAYQLSPHDTHDWDTSSTPILVDGMINGKPRKMVITANRNGYFFVIDRVSGKAIKSFPMSDQLNWAFPETRPDTLQPQENPEKEASQGGVYVRPGTTGWTNWPPHSYSPQTGLFYVGVNLGASLSYMAYAGREPRGWGGRTINLDTTYGALQAIDYKTGKVVWAHESVRSPLPTSGVTGILSTAGNLVFAQDGGGDFIAFNANTGKPLWHDPTGGNINGPMSYMLDGKQYIVASLSPGGLTAYSLP